MSVEVRIKSALQDTKYKPDPNGDYTTEIDIPSSGLNIDETKEHELVEDAFVQDDETFHLYVSTDRKQQVSFEVI
ncbi:hypothetical protein Har1130_03690 [Haloarcula sp. CBA1130]|uniref:hypothetical protein n=1 Tax=unclassified Haloarcula TaxID=2624677 RepID=UPI0012493B19|nr:MULTISPECIES: hypothetical protein [unclassified Haloarcula]KAA9398519.1 hypothetical protein Har1129_09965 [Haloarcula sp. CBA1129]KAA9401889.1 hypothetical protein Har1130_03690 [Haloarcula sp. CBA1130]